jgi:predicted dehydrogenase
MTTLQQPLRFGLVGTGHWAQITHAPALASAEGIEFAAVWGRSPDAAGALAATYQATAYSDIDAFLADVDAVAFSVPPDVQNPIAIQAARAGKHLLLEKPVGTSVADAGRLAETVRQARVASVVFFTARFRADVRAWLADITSRDGWAGGWAIWLGSSVLGSSPFNTPWRRDKGALWDLAPHAVSLLWAALGPVTSVTADAGRADLTHLVLHHESAATSALTVTLSAPEAAAGVDLQVWGDSGRSAMPAEPDQPLPALRTALAELAGNARSGHLSHPCDVHFGREITRVLAEADHQLAAARRPGTAAR